MPEHIYITLELSNGAYAELKAKLIAASLEARIFEHESNEHLDYDALPLKSVPLGGDVTQDTCNEIKAKFVTAGLYDRVYHEEEEGPELVDMSGTAVKLLAV
jgi:hypothetical protein